MAYKARFPALERLSPTGWCRYRVVIASVANQSCRRSAAFGAGWIRSPRGVLSDASGVGDDDRHPASTLFGDMFGTAAMRAVFGELALSRALRRGRGGAGARPGAARHRSRRTPPRRSRRPPSAVAADREPLDLARLKRETENVGYPILPLVRQLAERAGEAGRWLHWGATTQDIMDSAVVLQIRDGLALIEADLTHAARPSRGAGAAAPRHADGRPHPSAARAADHLRLQGGGVAVRRSTAMPSASAN